MIQVGPDGSSGKSGCRGCPVGKYGPFNGSASSCFACPAGKVCPGYLEFPLLPPSDLSHPACDVLRDPPASFTQLGTVATEYLYLLLGAWLVCFSTTLAVFFLCKRLLPHDPKDEHSRMPCFRRLDLVYSVLSIAANHVSLRAGRHLEAKKSPLGGLFFLLFFQTLLALWAFLVLTFYFGNVAVLVTQEQLGVYSDKLLGLPWATPPKNSILALQPTLPLNANATTRTTTGSNLQLRLFAQSKLGCTAPLSLNYEDINKFDNTWSKDKPWFLQSQANPMNWTLGGRANCSGADEKDSVSLLTLTCQDCNLKPDSSLTFALNFTCQSFALELLFVDATGTANLLPLDPRFTQAINKPSKTSSGQSSTGQQLATVTWTLAPSLSFFDNALPPGAVGASIPPARGYSVAFTSAITTYVDFEKDLINGGVQPEANAVLVTVNLPLQPTLSHITLTSKQTWLQLVSQMMSFLGIMGVFHGLFLLLRALHKPPKPPLSNGQPPPSDAAEAGQASGGKLAVTENPLHHLPRKALRPSAPPAPAEASADVQGDAAPALEPALAPPGDEAAHDDGAPAVTIRYTEEALRAAAAGAAAEVAEVTAGATSAAAAAAAAAERREQEARDRAHAAAVIEDSGKLLSAFKSYGRPEPTPRDFSPRILLTAAEQALSEGLHSSRSNDAAAARAEHSAMLGGQRHAVRVFR